MGVTPLRQVPPLPDHDAVMARMAPLVLGWCRRLGAGNIDVEDAAQEVLLVLGRRLEGLSQAEDLEPWVFTVTRNVVRRHARRAWWRRWVPGVPEGPSRAASPEATSAAAQVIRLMDRCLAKMPAEQREILVLRLVEERSDSEVARLLGLPHGTVKSRLRLARANFIKNIQEDPTLAPLRDWMAEEDEHG